MLGVDHVRTEVPEQRLEDGLRGAVLVRRGEVGKAEQTRDPMERKALVAPLRDGPLLFSRLDLGEEETDLVAARGELSRELERVDLGAGDVLRQELVNE